MSMLLMVKAMQVKVGNPLRKLVLIKLADNANDSGECWPSYQHIADQCEISRRSVMVHVDGLCEMGLLRKEYRPGPKGNTSNLYIVLLGGAANSPGVVKEVHQGGAADSLGGGAGDSPRTSHSFEPVNEPLPAAKACSSMDVKEDVIVKAWNSVAKERNFKGARGISDKIARSIKQNYALYLKEAKKDGKSAEDIKSLTDFTCGYLQNGFPGWATPFHSGNNDAKWRADLEYATRKSNFEKIFFSAE